MKQNNPIFETLLTAAKIDKIVHEPARLLILSILFVIESADFVFLNQQTELTRGNLSTHIRKLEDAGYVLVKKEFVEKKPMTVYSITKEGSQALGDYRDLMKKFLNELE